MNTTTRAAPLPLLILLLAFPQLSETIYAPALPDIAAAYGVGNAQAQLTMSVYFLAFAVGVVCWGRLADLWGRRPALQAALCCYAAGAGLALVSGHFATLLLARLLLAFGASAGSVVVQTMLRDAYQGPALAAAFATVGSVLAFSPALGPALGAMLVEQAGHLGVFAGLCLLAAGLLASTRKVGETRPATLAPPAALGRVAWRMLGDAHVRASVWLVAGFNLILFGYYTLAPFTLQQLGMPPWLFGASGLLVAAGGVAGAALNRRLQARLGGPRLIRLAIALSVAAALLQLLAGVWLSGWSSATGMLAAQCLLALAFGGAIPNVLSAALHRYREEQGTAGALFGLQYYLLIAGGLGLMSALYQPQPAYQATVMLALSLLLWPAARHLQEAR